MTLMQTYFTSLQPYFAILSFIICLYTAEKVIVVKKYIHKHFTFLHVYIQTSASGM